jgi:hypothetical protein
VAPAQVVLLHFLLAVRLAAALWAVAFRLPPAAAARAAVCLSRVAAALRALVARFLLLLALELPARLAATCRFQLVPPLVRALREVCAFQLVLVVALSWLVARVRSRLVARSLSRVVRLPLLPAVTLRLRLVMAALRLPAALSRSRLARLLAPQAVRSLLARVPLPPVPVAPWPCLPVPLAAVLVATFLLLLAPHLVPAPAVSCVSRLVPARARAAMCRSPLAMAARRLVVR